MEGLERKNEGKKKRMLGKKETSGGRRMMKVHKDRKVIVWILEYTALNKI